ncbi:hypothetical protein Q7P35_011016 [Cladosporium inversicolor]
MTPPIAILGAGPSGLTLGRLLHLAEIDFVIFERDASAASAWGRGGSGTLDLHEGSGLLALQEAGLFEEFKKKARYDVPLVVADMHGEVRLRHGDGEDTDRPEIDRRDLRLLLLGSVPNDKIRWGAKVERVHKEGDDMMSICFADGTVESGFRLVVGADGAWSKARSLVTNATPKYAGRYYLTSNISPASPFYATAESMAGTGNYMSMGGRRLVAAMRLGDRSYYTFAGLSLPESWKSDNAALLEDPEALKRVLVTKYLSDWSKINTDLIAHSDGEFYIWPLYGLAAEEMEWQTVPGVALVGDAAHICPPGGDGVNVAMHDSLDLAQQIIKLEVDRLDEAVVNYEKLMFPRAKDTIENSAKINDGMFSENSPKPLLQMFSAMMQNGAGESGKA